MINSPLEDIEAAALQLAPSDRAHLAERLLVSLDEDDEILASWVAEAERRGDAYDRGEMGAIDFDESIARLKAKLAAAA
jgi:putative addiction module component (TIGR02574 family)